jgi:hypothetical protein
MSEGIGKLALNSLDSLRNKVIIHLKVAKRVNKRSRLLKEI